MLTVVTIACIAIVALHLISRLERKAESAIVPAPTKRR